MRLIDPTTPVLIHTNAGKPVIENGKTSILETVKIIGTKVNGLIDVGVNIIGICCGTSLEHIRVMAEVIKKTNG